MLHFDLALWSAAAWGEGWMLPEIPEQDANRPYKYRCDRMHLPALPPVKHSTCQVFHRVIKYLKVEETHKNHPTPAYKDLIMKMCQAYIVLKFGFHFQTNNSQPVYAF